jgi:hypothetical protein
VNLEKKNVSYRDTKCIGILGFISITALKDIESNIKGVSRLVDVTAGGYFLGLCVQNVHRNICPILDGYGVMGNF